MDQLCPCLLLEKNRREMLRAADRDRGYIQRSWLVLRLLKEILETLEVRVRIHDEEEVECAEGRDRNEVGLRVEGKFREKRHADRGAVRQHGQGVPVRSARECGASGRDASGSRHVLDDEALPELL